MRIKLTLFCLFLVPALLADTPVKLVMVKVKNLDYEAMHFRGCQIQQIVIRPDESCVVQMVREGKPVFYGLMTHWQGDDIQISIASMIEEGGKRKATDSKEAVLSQRQPKEFVVGGIRYLVSAREISLEEHQRMFAKAKPPAKP
jgi:hypothetical protein